MTTTERLEAAGLGTWREDGGAITRTYATTGWPVTLLLVNAIGFLAETEWHHPDLQVSYGAVTVRLTTHDAGDTVTDKDLALARRIEDVATHRPQDGGPPEPRVKP